MGKLPSPSEDAEQVAFIEYLEIRGLKFTAITNHTYNPHRSQQNKNRLLGLRKGLCDVLVVLPVGLAFVEMKRQDASPSDTTPAQRGWIEALNEVPCVEARVCKGADLAIAFIEELLPSPTAYSPAKSPLLPAETLF